MRADGVAPPSYAYRVDYRQNFDRYFAASGSYLNEGHLPGHHRDGVVAEAWGRIPVAQSRVSASVGIGAYYFYDTQNLPWPSYSTANIHGMATITSFAATSYFTERWFVRLQVDHIVPPGNQLKVTTASMGLGFWFDGEQVPALSRIGDPAAAGPFHPEREITVLGGQTVVNTVTSPEAPAFAIEYRQSLDRHVEWTASIIDEGNTKVEDCAGFALQCWIVNTLFPDCLTVGLGLGPYVFEDRSRNDSIAMGEQVRVCPLATLTLSVPVSLQVSDPWNLRFEFHRVTTRYNRDADIILFGLGYRWPR
jgi:hypothetical protein